MKKISRKMRTLDVRRSLLHRSQSSRSSIYQGAGRQDLRHSQYLFLNNWINRAIESGLKTSILESGKKRKELIIYLPEVMNFSTNYENTTLHLTAIRKLSEIYEISGNAVPPKKSYKLKSVNFDSLRNISTSAGLVLTAEISRWESSIRNQLTPNVEKWDKKIYKQMHQLGFFDLFKNPPDRNQCDDAVFPGINFVKYIKGSCEDSSDTTEKKKILKYQVAELVGEQVSKWTFLHTGLSEAVTNVSHHAYSKIKQNREKSWYLTGSYNETNSELKIAFYDQGVGIPSSLPSSEIWEKVLDFFSRHKFQKAERLKHAHLIRAAMKIDRTSTEKNDRGKGLQDLLAFARQRGEGYLAIISYHGLYKYTVNQGQESEKSVNFVNPLKGTLIIWSVKLGDATLQS